MLKKFLNCTWISNFMGYIKTILEQTELKNKTKQNNKKPREK